MVGTWDKISSHVLFNSYSIMRNMVALSSVTKPNSKRNQLLRQLGRERINSAVIICRLISLMSGRGSRLVLYSFYNRAKKMLWFPTVLRT